MVDQTHDRESLRRLMGEAVVLSPDDSQRYQVEHLMADADEWAQHEWQLLIEETNRLREQVQRTIFQTDVHVPEDLDGRLLELSTKATVRTPAFHRWGWLTVGAAAMLVIAAFLVAQHDGTKRSDLQTLAVLAINNHVNHIDDERSFQSATRMDLERQLTAQVDFDVHIPRPGGAIELLGARKCKLGTRAVAYTLWRGPGGKASLFQ